MQSLTQTFSRFLQNYFGRFWLVVVYLFLYTPLFFLILFSFNSTRQDGIFTGFSTRWYTALLNDSRLVSGFFLSLRVAVITGTLSTILGTFAAFVLVRYQRFRGRSLFSGLVSAPLVMPEVIIGLSLLLLMVSIQHAIGWPERGVTTIVTGHTLLGMAYATVVISARLREMDRTIEEVAQGRIEAGLVVPGNHVAGIGHAHMLGLGCQALPLGHVLAAHHVAALGRDQQQRVLDAGQVGMDVVTAEVLEALHDGRLMAGVQPLGTQLALLFCPGGAEVAHGFGIHAQRGLADGVHIPGQGGRVGATARARHRRIDDDQASEPGRLAARSTYGNASAHGVADQRPARKAHCLGEGGHVGGLGIESIVQARAGRGQTTAAHVQHIGVELTTQVLGHEAPCHGRAGDAGDQDDGVALRALAIGAAVAEIVLAYAVGVDVAAVEKCAGHAVSPQAMAAVS